MSPARIGTAIRRRREAQDLTQRDLAKKARVSQPYLAQLESGQKKNPALAIVQRIAKALGVTLEELLQ